MKKRYLGFVHSKVFLAFALSFMLLYSFVHNTAAKTNPNIDSILLIVFFLFFSLFALAPLESRFVHKQPLKLQFIVSGFAVVISIFGIIQELLKLLD